MPRRRVAQRRTILPDPKFHDHTVAKFINHIMVSGKKSVAESIVYGAFDVISESRPGQDVVQIFKDALEAVSPVVEVRSRRVGGATYQVPHEVRESRRQALAMRWLVESARCRSEKSMPARLAGELLDASEERGDAFKRKEDTHRMAEANRAFSHYRF